MLQKRGKNHYFCEESAALDMSMEAENCSGEQVVAAAGRAGPGRGESRSRRPRGKQVQAAGRAG
jgi:hypothetical protein